MKRDKQTIINQRIMHRYQQQELDDYHDARQRAKEAYMEHVQELQRQKRELKTERLLTYQEEQKALGKPCE